MPERSASEAPTCCRNSSATASLLTGAFQVSRFNGLADEPTLLNAVPVVPAFVPRACSADGSENAPLTRWPVAVEDGLVTLSSASPAVEMTFAVVAAFSPSPGPA